MKRAVLASLLALLPAACATVPPMAPAAVTVPPTADALQALDLRELFPGQASAELDVMQQAYCMTAVGAALRQEAD